MREHGVGFHFAGLHFAWVTALLIATLLPILPWALWDLLTEAPGPNIPARPSIFPATVWLAKSTLLVAAMDAIAAVRALRIVSTDPDAALVRRGIGDTCFALMLAAYSTVLWTALFPMVRLSNDWIDGDLVAEPVTRALVVETLAKGADEAVFGPLGLIYFAARFMAMRLWLAHATSPCHRA
ncbi:MAG: hypothetical protein ACFBWO_00530 [Paracoccaceae bacterium]